MFVGLSYFAWKILHTIDETNKLLLSTKVIKHKHVETENEKMKLFRKIEVYNE